MVRRWFYAFSFLSLAVIIITACFYRPILWVLVVIGPIEALGFYDSLQRRHVIRRNFPVVGRLRYLLEELRPEIQQYFIESNIDAFPIEREYRSIVYQRAKGELETRPFGTQRDVYRVGYEWASHSMAPVELAEEEPRITIGGPQCKQPYSASLFNISAMSFGALSKNAVLALNEGARAGGFLHNTGEGGLSPHHLEPGGDLIWQIGTGYFGCRTEGGNFDPKQFEERSAHENVKMIELKISQGAKPGHGGILPAVKVTPEIAAIRGVPAGKTVFSPPCHKAFCTPHGLIEFIAKLRELSGGKPVGFKLCVGSRSEFLSVCKAMLASDITPDFITVDGGEGGTGAAPLEFSNSLGMPARDAWIFVNNVLIGTGLRERIRIMATGKIFTGFHMVRALALGADFCATARGMMLALGCIQSLRCNTDKCPTGITTQNPALMYGLYVPDKAKRVARYHAATIKGFMEMLSAMGLRNPGELGPQHIYRRVDDLKVESFEDLYEILEPGQLLRGDVPEPLLSEWRAATPDEWPKMAC